MTVNQKIQLLREQLNKFELDAYVIPSTDPHMGEYVPEHWNERAWISGFTGSAGTVVITKDFAGLWTDSRYFIQAGEQLADSEMELVKLTVPHTPQHVDWILNQFSKGARIGINGQMVPISMVRKMQSEFDKKGLELITLLDLIKPIWKDRPTIPANQIFELDVQYAGKSRTEKISQIRSAMAADQVTHHLLCTLDEIAWVMNLRGTDVPFNPLFVSFLIISQNKQTFYIDAEKIPQSLLEKLKNEGFAIRPYAQVSDDLTALPDQSVLAIDIDKTNQAIANALPTSVPTREQMGYATYLKSIKNDTELRNLRATMIKDGVAWVKYLHWIDQNIGKQTISEMSAADKLDAFREEQKDYQGRSFHPISSYGYHGAVVHYAVSEDSSIELKPEGVYLCDTGGHYLGGTTDTTRTLALGPVSDQQKKDFTLALKGTLAVSMLRFPKGTKGYQMDILARKALWDHGMNFGHGTGHGVGFFLNVHEGPQTIGTGATGNMQTAFEPGMVTTVEPAIYRDGSHGMRTENMTICVEDIKTDFGEFLCFETITMVPIDQRLLDLSLLDQSEIDWLNNYHQIVYQKLSPLMDEPEKKWLKKATKQINHGSAD